MLTAAENERLSRVTGNAPAGQMLRRYWVPACLAEEVAEADGTPVRVRLFGEQLVAFRDTTGRLALLDDHCPHRRASMALGRNEDGGLRCIYHGWKFDATGACTDMPTEPDRFGFRDRLTIQSYPVREAGDLLWAYLRPADEMPAFPQYDWMSLPRSQIAI